MKHTIAILPVAALLLAACTNDRQAIEQVAYGYLNAMGNYRPTEARAFSTPKTCEVTLAFYEKMMEHTDSSAYSDNIPATITIGEIVVDDTLATAQFHKSTPIKEQDGSINLVKRDGQWWVDLVLDVPALPFNDPGPRILSEEEIKGLQSKYGKKK